MVQEFLLEIKTKNNYQAKVINPENGRYHCDATYPTAYDPFDWFDNPSKNKQLPNSEPTDGQVDNVEHEILNHFWEMLK